MAVKTTASESDLGHLHSKVAKVITGALNVFEKAQNVYLESDEELGLPMPEISPALLSVAAKFLADNKITCAPEDSVELSELDRTLAAKRERKDKKLQVGNVIHLAS